MGNLVFQAALGGTVTLVGPNTAATTSLTLPATDGSSGQPLKTDGSGALSFGTLGVAGGGTGVTSTPSNGQLLIGNGTGFTAATLTAGSGVSITNGAGAITITGSGSGAFGTDLSYVDYLLTLSSAIGSTVLVQAISLDGTSELMILQGNSAIHAVVFNTSTNTFGTPALVRTGADFSGTQTVGLAKISSTAILVCSLPLSTTALETVVLTVSGSAITVNTAAGTTLAANSDLITANTRLVVVGSSYVLNYVTTSTTLPKFRAITVSGTTPSIGSELAYAGGNASHNSYAHSSSILIHFSASTTVVYAYPITVSGTTLTGGTQATATTTSANICTGTLDSSRYALVYLNTTGRGAVVSVAGSVATISTAVQAINVGSWSPQVQIFSNQAFILTGGSASDRVNVLTDTAGVATVGAGVLTIPAAGNLIGYLSTGKVFLSTAAAGNSAYYQYGISSGSPVLEKTFQNVTSTTVVTAQVFNTGIYGQPLSGPPQSGSGLSTNLRTSSGKVSPGRTFQLPFSISSDGTYPAKLQQSANPFSSFNDAISDAINWGCPTPTSSTATTIQLRKVTLA